jgi:hypothetical protein
MDPPVRSAPSHPGINVNGYVRQFPIADEYAVAFIGTDE